MSYRPKAGEAENLENLVSKRIDEMLGSIKGISTMYVEPGDMVVVTIEDDVSEQVANRLRKIIASVFNKNTGIFVTEGIKFQVLKKGEQHGQSQESPEEVKKLRQEVEQLKARLESLEGFVSKYAPV